MRVVKAGHTSHTWSVVVRSFLIGSYIIFVVETVSLRKSTRNYSCYFRYSNEHLNLQLASKHYLSVTDILFVRSLVLTHELTRNQPGGQWSLWGVRSGGAVFSRPGTKNCPIKGVPWKESFSWYLWSLNVLTSFFIFVEFTPLNRLILKLYVKKWWRNILRCWKDGENNKKPLGLE